MGENLPSWGLVLLRILVGALLIVEAWSRVQNGTGDDLVLGTREAYAAAPGVVKAWGESVVLVHPSFFSVVALWGALLGGIALFLGAFTRPAGFALALLFANVFFVSDGPQRLLALMLGVCCLACAISRAGMRSGADVFLQERLPVWLTWSRG